MIKVNLSESDNPVKQIEQSLRIISEIDYKFDKREKIILDLSEVKWVLPCTVILISGKLKEILGKGAEVSYISPKKHESKRMVIRDRISIRKNKRWFYFYFNKTFCK